MYFYWEVRSFGQILAPWDGVFLIPAEVRGGKKTRPCTFSGSQETTVKAGLTLPSNTTVTLWKHVIRIKTQRGLCSSTLPLACGP